MKSRTKIKKFSFLSSIVCVLGMGTAPLRGSVCVCVCAVCVWSPLRGCGRRGRRSCGGGRAESPGEDTIVWRLFETALISFISIIADQEEPKHLGRTARAFACVRKHMCVNSWYDYFMLGRAESPGEDDGALTWLHKQEFAQKRSCMTQWWYGCMPGGRVHWHACISIRNATI